MWSWLDSTACAVALYGLAGVTALVLGVAEQRHGGAADPRRWPTFWFATGGLLLIMAVGRASHVNDLLVDIGREQARSGGWYEVRRSLQTWVIGGVAAVWAVTVAVMLWRIPERRRYLPTAVIVLTLAGFIGVRLISLHQVDALLHERLVRGVTLGAAIEIALLMMVIMATAWRFRRPDRGPAETNADVPVGAGFRERTQG